MPTIDPPAFEPLSHRYPARITAVQSEYILLADTQRAEHQQRQNETWILEIGLAIRARYEYDDVWGSASLVLDGIRIVETLFYCKHSHITRPCTTVALPSLQRLSARLGPTRIPAYATMCESDRTVTAHRSRVCPANPTPLTILCSEF